ncbi:MULTISPECIES: eCIS core domain-containing protein [unclassified Streptomyces]|uniref:eCIS core domain-containing protein n=1 Tax=unclassified Streptomyces TaxID=2593676 RepID=UPI00404211D0
MAEHLLPSEAFLPVQSAPGGRKSTATQGRSVSEHGVRLLREGESIPPVAAARRALEGLSAAGASNAALMNLAQARSSQGQGLELSVRREMEGHLGADLSEVRVHTGHLAEVAVGALRARACTVGQDVFFGPGEYQPMSRAGRELLAHELAHAVQQSHGGTAAAGADACERQAATAAACLSLGRAQPSVTTCAAPGIARQTKAGTAAQSNEATGVVDIDVEAVTAQEAVSLQQRGIRLPSASGAAADPKLSHPDYVDRRVEAVGYGIYEGGYLLYCTGLPLPILVPESYVSFASVPRAPVDPAIHPNREAAVQSIPIGPPKAGQPLPYAYYRAAGGLVVPTHFSPITTPRTVETALQARRQLADEVQRELVILALELVGGALIAALAGRLARIRVKEASPKVGPTAERARALARSVRESGNEVVANIGGTGAPHEPPHAINVNNMAVPRRNIPNLVVADGADIGLLFEPGSLDRVVGYEMAPEVINWHRAAPGAFKALRSGGRFEFRFIGARFNPDPQRCARALTDAGFVGVRNLENGVVTGIKP